MRGGGFKESEVTCRVILYPWKADRLCLNRKRRAVASRAPLVAKLTLDGSHAFGKWVAVSINY